MGYDIEETVEIESPPEEVWLWTVEDPSREQQWRNLDGKGVQELEFLGEGNVEDGSRFQGTVKVGPGEPQRYVNEVTKIEPYRHISWKTVDAEGALGGYGTYELEPTEKGTRFHIRLAYPPLNFLGRIQRPIVRLLGRRMISKMLQKLKRLVEEGPPAESPI